MTPRDLKRIARRLVEACDGADAASKACRVSPQKLSDYGNPNSPLFMPIDVVADLQADCGKDIVSASLSRQFRATGPCTDLLNATMDVSEAVLAQQCAVRAALADGAMSQRELDEIAQHIAQAEAALDNMRASHKAAETVLGKAR